MKIIGLIDYGLGNLRNVERAFCHQGALIKLITSGNEMTGCDGFILPGVGHFGDGMKNLREKHFEEPLKQVVREGVPLLGICLGMQMLLDSSEEAPGVNGLGIIPGKVIRFPSQSHYKIPHIGWNEAKLQNLHPLHLGIKENAYFYFVHSYYAVPENPAHSVACCHYIISFTASVSNKNVYGAQFHPEKSQEAGLQLISNFITQVEQC